MEAVNYQLCGALLILLLLLTRVNFAVRVQERTMEMTGASYNLSS